MPEPSRLPAQQQNTPAPRKKGGGTGAKPKSQKPSFRVEKEHVTTLRSFFDEYRYCRGKAERDTVSREGAEALAMSLDLDMTDEIINDMTSVCFAAYFTHVSNFAVVN